VKINDVIKEETRVSDNGTPNRDIEAEKQKNAARTTQLTQAPQGNTLGAVGNVSPGDQARTGGTADPNLDQAKPGDTPPITAGPSNPIKIALGTGTETARTYPDGRVELLDPRTNQWQPTRSDKNDEINQAIAKAKATTAGAQSATPAANTTAQTPAAGANNTAKPAKPTNTNADTNPGFFKSLFNKNARMQRGARAQIQKYAQPRIDYWYTMIGADPSMANNRQALQQYVQGFIKDRIPPRDVTPPTDMSQRGVANYITDWVGKFTTTDVNNIQRKGGIGTFGAPKQDYDLDVNGVNYHYSATNKQWTDENGETYQEPEDVQKLNKLAYQKMNPQAAGDEAGATIGGIKLPKGVEIISQEPIIVRYKNRDFAMDNRGDWTMLKGDTSNLQSFQAFLDKVSGFNESVDLAEVLWQKMKRAQQCIS